MSKPLSVPALLLVLLAGGCGTPGQTSAQSTDVSVSASVASTSIPVEVVAPRTTTETREDEPLSSRAPTAVFVGGDTNWATDFDQLAKESPVIVHVAVSTPAVQIGVADPLENEPLFGINRQSVQVIEVLRDDFDVAKTGAALQILMSGPNMNNKAVAASVEAGTAQLSDNGLAAMQNGQYVLFLVPSAVSQDPNLSFNGTLTPLFDYQSILPVSGEAVGPARPIVSDQVSEVSLKESVVTELENNFALRPAFEVPATLTELRDSVLRLTDLAGQEE